MTTADRIRAEWTDEECPWPAPEDDELPTPPDDPEAFDDEPEGMSGRPATMRETCEALFELELGERLYAQPVGWLYNEVDCELDELGQADCRADLCLACGELRRLDFGDPCLGKLPGVFGACCGHGRLGASVNVDGWAFGRLIGPAAARKMRELGGHPPARAFLLDPIGGAERIAERIEAFRERLAEDDMREHHERTGSGRMAAWLRTLP